MASREQSSQSRIQISINMELRKAAIKLIAKMEPVVFYIMVTIIYVFLLRPLLPEYAAMLFWIAIVIGTPLGQSREMVRTLACGILKIL